MPSPVSRGDQPAYRIGKRRMGVRQVDVSAMISPADGGREGAGDAEVTKPIDAPKLTPEEGRQGLEALQRVKQLQKRILERRGGEFFPPSWVLINEARDERTRELAER